MKVYLPAGKRDHMIFITPGLESDSSDFFDEAGQPRQFTIKFVAGVADVPSNIGAYLLSKGVAQASPVILPSMAETMAVQDRRVRNHRILSDAYHEGA